MEYGTVEALDVSVRHVLNTAHPERHLLCYAAHGWYVSLYVCNGVAMRTRHYPSEKAARVAWERLAREMRTL